MIHFDANDQAEMVIEYCAESVWSLLNPHWNVQLAEHSLDLLLYRSSLRGMMELQPQRFRS
jgi:hypothetical protein